MVDRPEEEAGTCYRSRFLLGPSDDWLEVLPTGKVGEIPLAAIRHK